MSRQQRKRNRETGVMSIASFLLYISTEYLQWLKLKIQNFISHRYLKFDLCDIGTVFHQLSKQVKWKLMRSWYGCILTRACPRFTDDMRSCEQNFAP